MMTGCDESKFVPDVETDDKLNILVRGNYYGHPNAKRAKVDNDPRQCVWHDPLTRNNSYTAPLLLMPSSTDGITEYQADYFDGQLRGNLITSKYTGGLYRVILRADGLSVIPQSVPPIALGIGGKGLSVTQAPDGTLIETRLVSNALYYHKPLERNLSFNSTLRVNAVFPRRGHKLGGYPITIYGNNFDATVTVLFGNENCLRISALSPIRFQCLVPPVSGGGSLTVDIQVRGSSGSYIFSRGFRYVSGHVNMLWAP
jgi:IPT/TIG domain